MTSQSLLTSLNNNSKMFNTELTLKQIDVGELKHFLYKDRKIFQYYVTDYTLPHSMSNDEKQRLYDLYQNFYHRLHNSTNLLRILFFRNNTECILGWLTTEFEIYVTFSPLITKEAALETTNKILEFIKKNRTKLFITSMPTLPGWRFFCFSFISVGFEYYILWICKHTVLFLLLCLNFRQFCQNRVFVDFNACLWENAKFLPVHIHSFR